jgi:hypothetical protein
VTQPSGLEPAGLEKIVHFLKDNPSSGRVRAAQILAVVADLVQLGFFPLFVAGFPSPLDAILDVVVSVAMVALVGWHWVFLPSIIAKLMPGLDLVPTWTAAVLFATRGKTETPAPPSETPSKN